MTALCLWSNFYLGEEIVFSANGFPRLTFLGLSFDYTIKLLWVDKSAMPSLKHLSIQRCTSLAMVPEGLRYITTLQILEIFNMPKEFIQRLQVINGIEGDDFYKVRHVPSILLIGGKSFISTLSFLLPHIQTHKNKIDNHSIFIHQMNDYRFSFCPKIPSCHIIIHSFVCLFKIASLQPAIYFNSPSISIFFY